MISFKGVDGMYQLTLMDENTYEILHSISFETKEAAIEFSLNEEITYLKLVVEIKEVNELDQ